MQNLHRDMRALGDGNGLFQTRQAGTGAHMHRVDAAIAGRDLGQFDHLGGVEEGIGQVIKPGGQAGGALLHPLADQALDLLHLGRRRLAVFVTHHRGAHLSRADIRHDVGADALLFQIGEETAQGGPGPLDRRRHHHGIVHRGPQHRAGRQMFAHQFGGDALRHFGKPAPVKSQAEFRMTVHVDKAGGHHLAAGIDHLFRFHRGTADIHNPVTCDGDIGLHARTTAAVDHLAVLDQQVHFGRLGETRQ